MNGVEILATQEVAVAFCFNWLSFWIAIAIVMGVCLAAGCFVSAVENDFSPLIVFCIMGAFFGLLFGLIFGSGDRKPTEYETQYKVSITDEVSMNEFLEKYEIIDQEGKIYTVREKD